MQISVLALALLALLALLAAAHADERREYLTGPYTFEKQDGEQRTFEVVERPQGAPHGYLITGWKLQVVDEDLNPIDLHETGREQLLYFHHAVLHEWDEELTKVVHEAQMVFLASPDMVSMGDGMSFPENTGILFKDTDPHWAICCHAYNYGDEDLSLYLKWEITYKEYVPETDKVITVEFLGHKLSRREALRHRGEQTVESLTSGTLVPGHGSAELIAVQWHLHKGVIASRLERIRNKHTEVIGEVAFEDGPEAVSNGIEVFPVVWPKGNIALIEPADQLVLTALAHTADVLDDVQEEDLLMVYTLLYVSYEDGYRPRGGMIYLNNLRLAGGPGKGYK